MKLKGKLQEVQSLQGKASAKNTASGHISIPTGFINQSYNDLLDKPQIEGVELVDNKTFEDLGLESITGKDLIDVFEEIWR